MLERGGWCAVVAGTRSGDIILASQCVGASFCFKKLHSLGSSSFNSFCGNRERHMATAGTSAGCGGEGGGETSNEAGSTKAQSGPATGPADEAHVAGANTVRKVKRVIKKVNIMPKI